MSEREERRRRRQRDNARYEQFARGVERFAPRNVESGYDDVYPMVSRRGRVMYGGKTWAELREEEAKER